MRTFLIVWVGQFASLIGSALTSFALGVWIYEETGSVTEYALVSVFFALPGILMSPVAGALVDRWNRRWVMLISDAGAACGTLIMALLLSANRLEIGHIYLITAANASFSAFQQPAYVAATTMLVPRRHYARASGLVDLAWAIGYILSPLAGFLMVSIQLKGIIFIDFATFLVAVVTLLGVRFPHPKESAEGKASKGILWREAVYGWSYIRARPGLLALLVLFAVANLFNGIATVLIVPLALAFTSADVLGLIGFVSTSGSVVSGVVMAAWGGSRRRIYCVLGFGALYAVATMFVGIQASVPIIAAALWVVFFSEVFVNGCSQAIWQSKVPPDVQGRVFSIRSMISQSTSPIAYLLAGPLADHVFEPMLSEGGSLAGSVGRVIGIGPGRGIGLMFILMGLLTLLTVGGGYMYPRLRFVEDELPDFDP